MANYSIQPSKYKPFTFVVNTALAGTSGSDEFKLPFIVGSDYRCVVDWGDGTNDNITYYNQVETTHTYPSGGTYEIKISGKCDKFSFVNLNDKLKITDIVQWGNIVWKDFNDSFYGCSSLSGYSAIDSPILEYVTDLTGMFRASTFDGNISDWETSKITNMDLMFYQANEFNNGGSPGISAWTTSNVVSTSYMFNQASIFNQPIEIGRAHV